MQSLAHSNSFFVATSNKDSRVLTVDELQNAITTLQSIQSRNQKMRKFTSGTAVLILISGALMFGISFVNNSDELKWSGAITFSTSLGFLVRRHFCGGFCIPHLNCDSVNFSQLDEKIKQQISAVAEKCDIVLDDEKLISDLIDSFEIKKNLLMNHSNNVTLGLQQKLS